MARSDANRCLCCPQKIRSLESPPPQASDGGRPDALAPCASSTWGHRQPRPEPQDDGEQRQDDSERLRGALRSLKGERKALRVQLQEREYVSERRPLRCALRAPGRARL